MDGLIQPGQHVLWAALATASGAASCALALAFHRLRLYQPKAKGNGLLAWVGVGWGAVAGGYFA